MFNPVASLFRIIQPVLAIRVVTVLYNTGKMAGRFPGHHRPGLIEASLLLRLNHGHYAFSGA